MDFKKTIKMGLSIARNDEKALSFGIKHVKKKLSQINDLLNYWVLPIVLRKDDYANGILTQVITKMADIMCCPTFQNSIITDYGNTRGYFFLNTEISVKRLLRLSLLLSK